MKQSEAGSGNTQEFWHSQPSVKHPDDSHAALLYVKKGQYWFP
ncbi:hypothetical protein [Leptolyngbya sp. O-77]|nr:hypothetical protein [Leptolyngbya sp. O-77]